MTDVCVVDRPCVSLGVAGVEVMPPWAVSTKSEQCSVLLGLQWVFKTAVSWLWPWLMGVESRVIHKLFLLHVICHLPSGNTTVIRHSIKSEKLKPMHLWQVMTFIESPRHDTCSGCGWRIRCPDLKSSFKSAEYAVADRRQWVILQLEIWAWG
jgi:hypothetical protein